MDPREIGANRLPEPLANRHRWLEVHRMTRGQSQVTGEKADLKQINARQFDLFALSLEGGPNFGDREIYDAYKTDRSEAAGAILIDPATWGFSTITLRRRVDHRWVRTDERGGFASPDAAMAHLRTSFRIGEPAEPLRPGERRRRAFLDTGPAGISPEFELLASSIDHLPALMAVGECYLALPKPDPNFVSDFQTNNFASRLFELYLLACFREQGILVRQDHVSPDFEIERAGATCWIEAVTANSAEPRSVGIGPWVHAPEDRDERLTGDTAERFAKTLRGKLQRKYEEMPHVQGKPFAIAIADFHESGSMVWSREALPTYLYGVKAYVEGEGSDRRAVGMAISHLTGKNRIPRAFFAIRPTRICRVCCSAMRPPCPSSTGWGFSLAGSLPALTWSGKASCSTGRLARSTRSRSRCRSRTRIMKRCGRWARAGARNSNSITILSRPIPSPLISYRARPIGSNVTVRSSATRSGKTRSSRR